MKLSEAKNMAAAPFTLSALMQIAHKAQVDHAKTTNARNSMSADEEQGHPIKGEHKESAKRLDAAKQLATAALMKHVGADVDAKNSEAEKMNTETELQKAQAKEAGARANVVQGIADRHGELINKANVEKIFHPPAQEQGPELGTAKKTAKNISSKVPK